MKKHLTITALAASALLAGALFLPDGMVYLLVALMAATVLAALQFNRKNTVKATRWAKAHPHLAQGYIAVIQLSLMAVGLFAGYNLRKMDVTLSDATAHVFTALMVIGFLSVQFLPVRDALVMPETLNRRRLAFLGISLSTLMLMTFSGNRLSDRYPDSVAVGVLEKADQAVFGIDTPQEAPIGQTMEVPQLALGVVALPGGESAFDTDANPEKSSVKAEKAQKKLKKFQKKLQKWSKKKWFRAGASAGMCLLGIFLILLLLVPLCAGICLITGAFGTEATVISILGGILLTGLSIFGMIRAGRLCKSEFSESNAD